MNATSTQMVEIDLIDVEDGFNPRSDFDEKRLVELEASIRQSGLVTALTVSSNGGEKFKLIAGERRLIAAKRAGLTEVPVVIREGTEALSAAIAENLIREDLDPIEEARALRRLSEAEKLATHKKLAERVGKSSAYVSERLRLLALQEKVQARIADGIVPVAAEPNLRKAAKVCPAIAECVCRLVARGEIEGRDLLERFDEVLYAVAESELREKPTMIDIGRGLWLSQVIDDPEQHASIAERWRAATPYGNSDDPMIRFEEPEVDAARASGRLLEYEVDRGGWTSRIAFLCDRELGADLATRALERAEKEAIKRAKDAAKARGGDPDELDPAATAEQQREGRRGLREKAKVDAEKARTINLELGRKLIARRGAKSRKEHSLDRARAIAEVILHDNPNLAARGLRLVLPQLQEVDVRQLKSGESREKVTYMEAEECDAYLRARIGEAKSANEVLELLADALIAATVADERELAQSRRVSYWVPAEEQVRKLLAADVKSVRPRRPKGGK
jgi:ParB/RepB/Spo0J family partition protein